jgi:phosphomannomutase
VSEAYSDADQERVDGLTVDFGDWWFNLRPSNTEPLLRLNLEAADRNSTDQRVAEVPVGRNEFALEQRKQNR